MSSNLTASAMRLDFFWEPFYCRTSLFSFKCRNGSPMFLVFPQFNSKVSSQGLTQSTLSPD
ncbi:MAG: hypothetical protein VW687_09535, partial [Curvibacter sp.]